RQNAGERDGIHRLGPAAVPWKGRRDLWAGAGVAEAGRTQLDRPAGGEILTRRLAAANLVHQRGTSLRYAPQARLVLVDTAIADLHRIRWARGEAVAGWTRRAGRSLQTKRGWIELPFDRPARVADPHDTRARRAQDRGRSGARRSMRWPARRRR